MRESPPAESRTPTVVYVDADPGQLRLFEAQFGRRYRVTLSAYGEELLDRVGTMAPVAALLADHGSGRGLVQQVTRLVRPELQGRALLSTHGGPLEVRASPLRLTQVLINLVVNAGQAVGSMQRTDVGRVQIFW
jgi:hypothetical protein